MESQTMARHKWGGKAVIHAAEWRVISKWHDRNGIMPHHLKDEKRLAVIANSVHEMLLKYADAVAEINGRG